MEEDARQFRRRYPDRDGCSGACGCYRQQCDRHESAHLVQAADRARPRYPAHQAGVGAKFQGVRGDREQRDQLKQCPGPAGCSQRLTSTVRSEGQRRPAGHGNHVDQRAACHDRGLWRDRRRRLPAAHGADARPARCGLGRCVAGCSQPGPRATGRAGRCVVGHWLARRERRCPGSRQVVPRAVGRLAGGGRGRDRTVPLTACRVDANEDASDDERPDLVQSVPQFLYGPAPRARHPGHDDDAVNMSRDREDIRGNGGRCGIQQHEVVGLAQRRSAAGPWHWNRALIVRAASRSRWRASLAAE